MRPRQEFWVKLAASVFFIGYCPFGSGTLGSVAGLLLFLLVQGYFWLQFALVIGLLCLGIWLCTLAEGVFKEKDSHKIVLDEVVGILITLLGVPILGWPVLLMGFFLNRMFDIYKPFGIRKLENIPGGWGVMLDDVGAGLYSNLALRVILAIF